MFQLARQPQRRYDTTFRAAEPAIDRSPALAPGKRALTDAMNAAHNGAPDYYGRAVDSAIRELDAIRTTALPAYVAIRRKQDLAPLTKQIELARSAMQVRHMILTANAHVYALEKSATHKDPMVLWLRERLDRVVARATKLGIYADAADMIPERFIDDTKQKAGGNKKTQNVKQPKITHQLPSTTDSTLSPTRPAQVRKPANTPAPAQRTSLRVARGTGSVPTLAAGGAPTEQRTGRDAYVRPGFRPTSR